MRVLAITKRIVRQFLRDKRSIALMMVAPLMVMTLLWLVLDLDQYEPTIAVIDVPEPLKNALEEQDATIKAMSINKAKKAMHDQTIDAYLVMKASKAKAALEDRVIDTYLVMEINEVELMMEGTDPTATAAVQEVFSSVVKQLNPSPMNVEVNFLHGTTDLNIFDYTGPVLIGYFIFFFVFLIGGVSFLRERTQGTLERMLATPLKRWEIVVGYLGGFGIFIIIQSIIIVTFSIYVLKIYMVGSILAVLIISFLLAMTALSLGTLLSAFSKNEFQMIQFIPIVIIPQVFFSGIFHTDSIPWLNTLAKGMPLTYGAGALREIMIRGQGLTDVMNEFWVLVVFSLGFIFLNIVALKRHRTL